METKSTGSLKRDFGSMARNELENQKTIDALTAENERLKAIVDAIEPPEDNTFIAYMAKHISDPELSKGFIEASKDTKELCAVIRKQASENKRLRDALNELLTAANQVSEPNEFWEMATEYGPYGSFYKTNWYDSETPADKLAYGIDKAREALERK